MKYTNNLPIKNIFKDNTVYTGQLSKFEMK